MNNAIVAQSILVTATSIRFFFFESSIIKPTTLNTNEQEAIGSMVADPATCVVSMLPKYQLCS